MMSSSSRKIAAKNVRISEHSKVVNDKFFTEEENFETMYIEEKQKDITEKVKQLETKMYEEFNEKKENLIQEAYETGKQKAFQEAETQIKQELKEIIEQANYILQEANDYKRKAIEESEQIKKKIISEQKEEWIDLLCDMTSAIVKTQITKDMVDVQTIYENTIKHITYDTKHIYIRIHPALREWIESSEFYGRDNRFVYYYDLNLEVGEVVVETDKEFIDATFERKIEELKEKIRGVLDDFHSED